MDNKKKLKSNLADVLELPQEVVGNTVKIIFWDDGRLLVENYQGIIKYEEQQIVLQCSSGTVHIRGEHLNILSLAAGELRIVGQIRNLELLPEGV